MAFKEPYSCSTMTHVEVPPVVIWRGQVRRTMLTTGLVPQSLYYKGSGASHCPKLDRACGMAAAGGEPGGACSARIGHKDA
jgi:hypothetical protein